MIIVFFSTETEVQTGLHGEHLTTLKGSGFEVLTKPRKILVISTSQEATANISVDSIKFTVGGQFSLCLNCDEEIGKVTTEL